MGRPHLLFVTRGGQAGNTAALDAARGYDRGRTSSVPESWRLPLRTMVRYPPIVRNIGYLGLPAYDGTKRQTVFFTAGPDATGWSPATHFEDVGLVWKPRQGPTRVSGADPVSKDHERTEFPPMIRMLHHPAEMLADAGVEVYDYSPDSTLDGFERVGFERALERA